jgi:hypothetical protein
MIQVFFTYNSKTLMLKLKDDHHYSAYQLCVLGLEKYFKNYQMNFSFSENPPALKNKKDFIIKGRISYLGKIISPNEIFYSNHLQDKTIHYGHYFYMNLEFFTNERIQEILKLDFEEI